jgi:hypothetical protein
MAANPLPRHDDIPGAVLPNAATATTINVVPSQEIVWQNTTLFAINIVMQSVNGKYPFATNSFPVPPKENETIGTYTSTVLAGTPVAEYPFTRTGATPMGNGKVIVAGEMP